MVSNSRSFSDKNISDTLPIMIFSNGFVLKQIRLCKNTQQNMKINIEIIESRIKLWGNVIRMGQNSVKTRWVIGSLIQYSIDNTEKQIDVGNFEMHTLRSILYHMTNPVPQFCFVFHLFNHKHQYEFQKISIWMDFGLFLFSKNSQICP